MPWPPSPSHRPGAAPNPRSISIRPRTGPRTRTPSRSATITSGSSPRPKSRPGRGDKEAAMRCSTSALRFSALTAFVALGLLVTHVPIQAGNPRAAVYSPATDRVFWFVHFSDTHIGTSGSQDSNNLTWLVTTGKSVIAPSFMVATGDLTDSTDGNIFGYPNGPYQAEWDQYKNILAGRVGADFYYDLPGNHDAYNDRTFAYYRANSVQGRATGGTQI